MMNSLNGEITKATVNKKLTGTDIRIQLKSGQSVILKASNKNETAPIHKYTNAQNDFTRNYFRNELIPSVKKIFPEADENIFNRSSIFLFRLYERVISRIRNQFTSCSTKSTASMPPCAKP